MKKILFAFVATFAMLFTACNSCSTPEPTPEPTGYNFDEVTISDYDYIASQYNDFQYLEADVLFDSILCVEGTPVINSIRTVFQCGDTCIMFMHSHGEEDTLYYNDYFMECMPMNARNAVTFDSCLSIIEPYRSTLKTKAMTFRRVLAPPFPEDGQYIFGVGFLVVDSRTGEIVDWSEYDYNDACMKSEK